MRNTTTKTASRANERRTTGPTAPTCAGRRPRRRPPPMISASRNGLVVRMAAAASPPAHSHHAPGVQGAPGGRVPSPRAGPRGDHGGALLTRRSAPGKRQSPRRPPSGHDGHRHPMAARGRPPPPLGRSAAVRRRPRSRPPTGRRCSPPDRTVGGAGDRPSAPTVDDWIRRRRSRRRRPGRPRHRSTHAPSDVGVACAAEPPDPVRPDPPDPPEPPEPPDRPAVRVGGVGRRRASAGTGRPGAELPAAPSDGRGRALDEVPAVDGRRRGPVGRPGRPRSTVHVEPALPVAPVAVLAVGQVIAAARWPGSRRWRRSGRCRRCGMRDLPNRLASSVTPLAPGSATQSAVSAGRAVPRVDGRRSRRPARRAPRRPRRTSPRAAPAPRHAARPARRTAERPRVATSAATDRDGQQRGRASGARRWWGWRITRLLGRR